MSDPLAGPPGGYQPAAAQPPPPVPHPYAAAVQPYAQPAHHPAPQALPGPRLVSAGGRLGAALLDVLLSVVTFGIGWLIWSAITWSNGQTPAKQLLGHVVADPQTGEPFDWGRMALRELAIKGLLGWLAGTCTMGVYSLVDACMVFRADLRTLHDQLAGSVVRHL